MNMLSFVGIGAFLEFQQGSLYLFLTIAYATVITNLVYLGICEILLQATKNMHWYYYSSIGFSGVRTCFPCLKARAINKINPRMPNSSPSPSPPIHQ